MSVYMCPSCKSTTKFYIDARSNVEVDGETGYVEDHDGFNWDYDAECSCGSCYYIGKEREFLVKKED